MDTETLLRQHADQHPEAGWIEYSDFYQEMLERYGDDLWRILPALLAHSDHNSRCCGVILAATRRPESTEAMRLIAPFMRDHHPLVRFTAFHQLLTFSWVEPHVEDTAYQIQHEEYHADDQTPCVMAIRLLLKANLTKYREDMIPKLQVIHDLEFGESLVTDLVMQAMKECGELG